MEKQKPDFDYEARKKKTMDQFCSCKSLNGKDCTFVTLLNILYRRLSKLRRTNSMIRSQESIVIAKMATLLIK